MEVLLILLWLYVTSSSWNVSHWSMIPHKYVKNFYLENITPKFKDTITFPLYRLFECEIAMYPTYVLQWGSFLFWSISSLRAAVLSFTHELGWNCCSVCGEGWCFHCCYCDDYIADWPSIRVEELGHCLLFPSVFCVGQGKQHMGQWATSSPHSPAAWDEAAN